MVLNRNITISEEITVARMIQSTMEMFQFFPLIIKCVLFLISLCELIKLTERLIILLGTPPLTEAFFGNKLD